MNISDKLNTILDEYSKGNKKSAYKRFKKIYLQNSKNIKLRFNLAVMQQELGLLKEAESNYLSLIKNSPEIKFKINLYNLYITKELYKNALDLINEIQSEKSNLIQVNQDKAYILYLLKNYKDSINECNKILNVNINNSYALNTIGLCLFSLQKFDEANKILLRALGIDSDNIKILNSLGRLNHELRKSKEAEVYFLKAYKLNDNVFETLNNMAGFYMEEGQYSKAINFYQKAEMLNPKNSVLLNNIAKTFICIEEIKKAETYTQKAISIDPKNDEFKKTLSIILLKKYDFRNAWLYFDGRLGLSDFKSKNLTLELVKNKIPKGIVDKNSKILILREQGIGDEILYGTMYSDLFKNFNNITIESDERLLPLFKNSFKNNESSFCKLGSYSTDANKINNFDYIIYAGSLGKFFRNEKKSFKKNPYIKNLDDYYDLELNKVLKNNKGYNIGISWKSFKNRYSSEKSLDLDNFKNILEMKHSNIFNLQYGEIEKELNDFLIKNNYEIITLKKLDLFNNFSGLANILKKLDVFITVSNSTAHLAGALGVKTLLIKPDNHASFHYWNYNDGKTPWYESVVIISKETLKNKEILEKLVKH